MMSNTNGSEGIFKNNNIMEIVKAKVIMLPTGIQTEIGVEGYWFTGNTLVYNEEGQHLYITTDEEIKEGDWVYSKLYGIGYVKDDWKGDDQPLLVEYKNLSHVIRRYYRDGRWKVGNEKLKIYENDCYKIIATTDKSLMYLSNNGRVGYSLPQPSQAFIEKYCKLGGIDEIMVKCIRQNISDSEFKEAVTKGEGLTKTLWYLVPKIDLHNTITIHPIKNSWSREEMISKLRDLLYSSNNLVSLYPDDTVSGIKEEEFKQWTKENLES